MRISQTQSLSVALDGSDHSRKALETAQQFATRLGVGLSAIFVFPFHVSISMTPAGLADMPKARVQAEADGKEEGARIFREAEQHMGASFASTEVRVGDPAEMLILYLEEHPGAHLFLGRRGLSRIKSLMLGGVSSKVVAHAQGPVTVI